MTRFKEKIIIFQNISSCLRLACRVVRDMDGVIISILPIEYVLTGELGEIAEWHDAETHICSFSSWQQFVNRRFPSSYFCKIREIYVY